MPQCPYYEKVAGDSGYAITGYCKGYRSGKLRVPTLSELRSYCIQDCFNCPVYRFRILEERLKSEESNVA